MTKNQHPSRVSMILGLTQTNSPLSFARFDFFLLFVSALIAASINDLLS